MSLISIVVPVYKVEKYLKRCVESILAQTYTNFELILVDDGSPDNCPAICDEYAKKDSRIHVIHQQNGGLSAARNAGIDWAFENSDSEWITFIDSDDWVHVKYLEVLYNNAIASNCSISICDFIRTSDNEPLIDISDTPFSIYLPEDIFVEKNTTSTIACAKLYSKNLFSNVRFPIGKIHEDEFTTYKLLFKQTAVVYTNVPLYFYLINENGIINSEWTPKKLDALDALREQILFFNENSFQIAKSSAQIKYAKVLADNIFFSRKSAHYNQHKNTIRALEKQLRKYLRKYRQFFPLNENKWLYQTAYPKCNQIYWAIVGILNKVKRG